MHVSIRMDAKAEGVDGCMYEGGVGFLFMDR